MKHALNLFGMISVAFLFYFVIVSILEEQYILPQAIIPLAGVRFDQWLNSFRYWAGIGVATAVSASILWYILGQWILRVNNLSDSGKRGTWFLFVFLPIAANAAAIIFTRQAQVGMWAAYTLHAVNALLCYYISTLLFSPPSYKYAPPLASLIRVGW